MKVYNHVVTYTSTHQRKNDTCHVCANFLQGLFRCASWACLLTPWFAVHLCVSWWVSSDFGLAGLAISPKHPLSHPFPASVRFACKFIWPDAADTIHGWYILVVDVHSRSSWLHRFWILVSPLPLNGVQRALESTRVTLRNSRFMVGKVLWVQVVLRLRVLCHRYW